MSRPTWISDQGRSLGINGLVEAPLRVELALIHPWRSLNRALVSVAGLWPQPGRLATGSGSGPRGRPDGMRVGLRSRALVTPAAKSGVLLARGPVGVRRDGGSSSVGLKMMINFANVRNDRQHNGRSEGASNPLSLVMAR